MSFTKAIFCTLALVALIANCQGQVIVGGYQASIDHNKANSLATFAVNEYNKVNNEEPYYQLSHVDTAQTQVVAGTNWQLGVRLIATTCSTAEALAGNKPCLVLIGGQEQRCTFTVYETLTGQPSLTNSQCTKTNSNFAPPITPVPWPNVFTASGPPVVDPYHPPWEVTNYQPGIVYPQTVTPSPVPYNFYTTTYPWFNTNGLPAQFVRYIPQAIRQWKLRTGKR